MDRIIKMVDTRKEERYGPDYHPVYEGEWNSGESITEQTYVPLAEQIADYVRSGEALEEYRRARWDFGPGQEDDEEIEPVEVTPENLHLYMARLNGIRDKRIAEERRIFEEEEKMKRNELFEREVEKRMKAAKEPPAI